MFNLLDHNFSQDDPQDQAVKETLAKTAFYLKEDFASVAPKFLEKLMKDASINIDVIKENAEIQTTHEGLNAFQFKLRGMENKQRILFNTSDVLSKTAAFHHILRVVGAMGASFEPFIPQVLPLLQQHMSFSHARVLRKYALKTLQYILLAKQPSGNQALFHQLFDQFSLHILSTACKEGGLKDLKLYFKELFHCMRVVKDNNDGTLFESAAKFETFGKLMERCLQNVTE